MRYTFVVLSAAHIKTGRGKFLPDDTVRISRVIFLFSTDSSGAIGRKRIDRDHESLLHIPSPR